MTDNRNINTTNKKQAGDAGQRRSQYAELLTSLTSLIEDETDLTAILANTAAALHQTFAPRFFWTGFYRVCGDELLLGPFQGPVACTHIAFGRGVCGAAWQRGATIVVDDVNLFPGHIACSSLSQSEIVVPVKSHGKVAAVIDIDSRDIAAFDDNDRDGLEQVAKLLSSKF
ncbi:MAG: GAF domain-containing protein [Prevotella sp.]|jgi:L-methionine (R)-S-oxide reductase